MNKLVVILMLMMPLASLSYAEWRVPETLASFGFGEEGGSIGIIEGDPYDEPRTLIDIDANGYVLVGDTVNKKIFVLNEDGAIESVIYPKTDIPKNKIWPASLFALDQNTFVVEYGGSYQIYSYSGDLLQTLNFGYSSILYVFSDYSMSVHTYTDNKYKRYSKNGDYIDLIENGEKFSKYKGYLNGKRVSNDLYSYKIRFPSKTYEFQLPTRNLSKITQNIDGSLHFLRYKNKRRNVVRVDGSGKIVGEFDVPKGVYGKPVFGKDGNAYSRKLSSNEFSIVRWTWVNEPQVPDIDFSKPLSPELVSRLDKNILRLLRNTIFAIYGRQFKSADLKQYFSSKDWYKPQANYSDSLLSDIDKKNIKLIMKYEANR